jgi:cytoskeletal protein RodZ
MTLPGPVSVSRNFIATPRLYKQSGDTRDFDREALNPYSSEATKTGTDDQIAQHDSAFDPRNTSPESELEATEQEVKTKGKQGTLNVSGANKEANTWRGPQEDGPDRNADKEDTSKRGHPNKRRKIEAKEDGTHVSYR